MLRIISALILLVSSLTAVADTVKLADNAPDAYTVVKGDTLWDISGRFLKEPWRWPEVWHMNREQIKNPHWIFPGQTIYLDRNGPSLSLNKPGEGAAEGVAGTVRLQPQIHASEISPIPSVAVSAIAPFLTRPLVVTDGDLAGYGTIVATDEGRLNVGADDVIFAKDLVQGVDDWEVYRRPEPLVDPVTNEVLGNEAIYLGTARLTEPGVPATLRITSSEREISVGDRLIPAVKPDIVSFVPHAPSGKLEGRVIKMHDSLFHSGKYSVIAVGVGRHDGIEAGHVLGIYQTRPDAVYRGETFQLPEQRIGLLFIFRVFDRVSYGLIVESSGPVKISDMVRQP
ncbi:MAG: LysM peptidoglycan-binding domain-containing protein [Betaproteobacteria bacterium]|nr:LysM peptidoglycan-binding domain-containing protein [Betaproteobacteria bacterium]